LVIRNLVTIGMYSSSHGTVIWPGSFVGAAGHLDEEESHRIYTMLQTPDLDRQRILGLVEEFNGHLQPGELADRLRLLFARA
jgi:hypothetical protein